MRTLTYINSIGEELVLTNSFPFLLQKFTESENVNIYNLKGSSQDGLTYLGNTLDLKDLSIEFTISGETTNELIINRNKITKIFNPKLGEGFLVYSDEVKERKIKCIVNKLPFFTRLENSNDKVYSGLISLTANNPHWLDLIEEKEEIALWKGDFGFELELIEGGIEMGHREPSLIVNVSNDGDVECGMRVDFKAIATLTNPSILNLDTQEYIKINKTMIAGEIIRVTTNFGNKKVESILNGVTSNAFNYIDIQSTFLQLNTGDNLFRYNADTGIDNLEIDIYYQPQYLGV